jgi:hypothetical protein
MDLVEIELSGVNWIGSAYDMDKWRALMNAVIYLYQVAAQLVASQIVFGSIESVTAFNMQ